MTLDSILARLSAILHKIRHPDHKLLWKHNPVLDDHDIRCEGDIVCESCKKFFWCRFYDNPNRFDYGKINDVNYKDED
jgi:hypothetical protein